MGAAEAATQLPQWAAYTIAGLGAFLGILLAFVFGLIANAVKQRSGAGVHSDVSGERDRRDCADCPSINRVTEGLNALNARIDRILEIRGRT